MPASSTTIRLSPTFWISGSVDAELVDPLAEHRERQVEVPLGIGRDLLRLIELEGEVHAALEVEAPLERHPGHGGVAHHAVGAALAQRRLSAGRGRRCEPTMSTRDHDQAGSNRCEHRQV